MKQILLVFTCLLLASSVIVFSHSHFFSPTPLQHLTAPTSQEKTQT